MARFDVFDNRDSTGLLLDIQADLLAELRTRIVVPLFVAETAPLAAERLNPVFVVANVKVVMMTQLMATVSVNFLGKRIASLDDEQDKIGNALDMLFVGF